MSVVPIPRYGAMERQSPPGRMLETSETAYSQLYTGTVEAAGVKMHATCETPLDIQSDTPLVLIQAGLLADEDHYAGLRTALARRNMIALTHETPKNQALLHQCLGGRDVMKLHSKAAWATMKAASQIPALYEAVQPDRKNETHAFDVVAHSLGAIKAARLANAKPEYAKRVIILGGAALGEHSWGQMTGRTLDFLLADAGPEARRRLEQDLHSQDPIRALARDAIYALLFGASLARNADLRLREIRCGAKDFALPMYFDAKRGGLDIQLADSKLDKFSSWLENELAAALLDAPLHELQGGHLEPNVNPEPVAKLIGDLLLPVPVPRSKRPKMIAKAA